MSWRSVSQAVVLECESKMKGQSYGALKRALHDAYPFGARSNYPYKMWCDEQRKALDRHPESPTNTTDGLQLFEE